MTSRLLAQFGSGGQLEGAVHALRESGHAGVEAYSPYPLVTPPATSMLPSRVPLITLLGGLVGILVGASLQWYCNAVSFPINVGGRPLISGPAYVPICFECMVLFGSLSGLYAFFILARLPLLDHRYQASDLFARATVDRFVLAVERPAGPSGEALAERLRELGAEQVVEVALP